ncbi:MAG TPA: SDR family oxidoreductase [Verrucomicrobiae bacterium]|nr:SDR family oxidoreductase [Verrucomicrobiae bacterium]
MKVETALITGAGSGIGLALAHEFAKHGHPLVLTSRIEAELYTIATEIATKHNIAVQVVGADLEDSGAPQRIFDFVEREGIQVGILVNNAGLGFRGKFWEVPLEQGFSIVRVNIEALLSLTHLFLPGMISRNRGRLLTTASIAGFEPGPLMSVYHASKAFVLSFTEALAIELEETNISVTALCPGPTDTDFFPKAGMMETKAFQKAHVMAPQKVAEIGYRAMMRGDRTVVAGASNKALTFARRFLTEGAQAKMNEKFYEEAKPSDRSRRRGDVERKHQKKSHDEKQFSE